MNYSEKYLVEILDYMTLLFLQLKFHLFKNSKSWNDFLSATLISFFSLV